MRIGGAAFALYRTAGHLAAPLARPHLRRRAARGKEDPDRLGEKLGHASAPRPEGADGKGPVWLHAVSVGESVALLPIADRLAERGLPLLLTTGTPTAAARVAAERPALLHQYAPLDAPAFARRFLMHWRPRAAIVAESEVWPTMLHALHRAGIPAAHVSARLSDRSFARWQRTGPIARHLFGLIGLALTQTEADADRFAQLGTQHVAVAGNLKFDAPPPKVDHAALAALQEALGGRPVWLAASLHPGEEDVVIAAHQALARDRADVLTVAAPRHEATARQLVAAAEASGLSVRVRSRGDTLGGDIYVVDTMGELGAFMSLCPVTFLGGSLVPLAGHNPAEPAALGSALLTGPSHGPMFAPFLAAGAAEIVTDAPALATAVAARLADPKAGALACERAARVLAQERGAVDRTLARLTAHIALLRAPDP